MKDAPPETHATLSAIQYFHKCDMAAKQIKVSEQTKVWMPPGEEEPEDMDLPETEAEDDEGITEESLAGLIASQKSWKEEMYGRMAVEIAKKANFFDNYNDHWETTQSSAVQASKDDIELLQSWKTQLHRDVEQSHLVVRGTMATLGGQEPVVQPLTMSMVGGEESFFTPGEGNGSRLPANATCLDVDQLHAHKIVVQHFEQTLAGCHPPPLQMVIYGEGGTGKSKVIQTLTEALTVRNASDILIKSAYTGIAASLIEGKTTHHIAQLSMRVNGNLTAERRNKLQLFWKNYHYLIVDEFSMIGKSFLALLS